MPPDNSSQSDNTLLTTEISVDNQSQQSQANDGNAESSPAKVEGAKELSTLDLVREALKSPTITEQVGESKVSPAEGKGTDVTGKDAQSPDAEEALAEEDKKLPFHSHPRWKQVIEERDNLKQQLIQLDTVKQESESYKERADRFDMVSGFVQQNGLQGDEVDAGFTIMAAISQATKFGGDPKAALDLIMPYVEHLQGLSGSVIPEDLQKKIDEGYLDEQTAQDISNLRAENLRATQRAEVATQQTKYTQQQTVAQQKEVVRGQILSTVSEWEANWKKADPDFAIKQADVMMLVENLTNKHGQPRNTEEALYLANFAKGEIDKKFKSILPSRTEMRTVTGGNPKGSPVQQVKSTQDAVQLALQGKYQMSSPSTIGV